MSGTAKGIMLMQGLQRFMKKGAKGAFVKLSDRSPKDATTERGRFVERAEDSALQEEERWG